MDDTRKRILWIDIIRIIAVLLVILIHNVNSVLYYWGKRPFINGADTSWWITGVAYKSLATVCVPLLFMISGYLLLSAKDSIFVFLRKRLTKILIPLFAWSIIYMIWEGVFPEIGFTLKNIKFAIRSILEGPVHFHLWFLYTLVALYLITPIFRKFVQSASRDDVLYFMGLWFFASVALDLVGVLKNIQIELFSQTFISGYLGYYLAGYYLGKREYSRKETLSALAIVLIMIFGKTLWTYRLAYDNGSFDTYLFEYINWHTFISSLASFIALKGLAQLYATKLSHSATAAIVSLSRNTFGIYLIHVIIWRALENGDFGFTLTGRITHPLIAVPLEMFAIFLISYLISYTLKKIPLIKTIVP